MLGLSEPAHTPDPAPAQGGSRLVRLVLTGFMGAGKSTVGPLLAQDLGWQFVDLDSVIETACALSVAEIFRQHGESYFRQREKEAVEKMRHERSMVLALGGGTVEDPATLAPLLHSAETCVVFLDAPLPELLARIQVGDGGDKVRPLLSQQEELEARHRRRLPHYRAAHLTVVTTGFGPEEVAKRILARVRQQWLI